MRNKRVIIEVKKSTRVPPLETFAMAPALQSRATSLLLDEMFEPLPTHRPVHHFALLGMNVYEEESVLVRGEIEAGDEQDLLAGPGVVAVWTDAPIAPFPAPDPFLSLAAPRGEFAPCDSPDCTPGSPKGTVDDVIAYLGCDRIWEAGVRGAGITIGVCDTGIDRAAVPAVVDGWSLDPESPWGDDQRGHGTMCGFDAASICPEAQLLDIGILKGAHGAFSGYISDAIIAFEWAIQRHRQDGTPHILSCSWGMYQNEWAPDYAEDPHHPFTQKMLQAIGEGIIVCFAAGNCGGSCPDNRCGDDIGFGRSIWGANGHEKVITVGAANVEEQWAGYSSQGPAALYDRKPDFCAPSHFAGRTPSDAGSSAACPVCAGVIGLLKQARPLLNQEQAHRVLAHTARNLCAPGWDYQTGYGMIQAYDAFRTVQKRLPNPLR
ncbi:MAG: S8 family serine peptidase [Anaerolineae bacterium]|nr:S8 family serine peptidase [Anaerolineae bacterium]